MPKPRLELVKFPRSDTVLPMVVHPGTCKAAGNMLHPSSNKELWKLQPAAHFEEEMKACLEQHLEYLEESCEQFMQTVEDCFPSMGAESETESRPQVVVPTTPHAKKTRRGRTRKAAVTKKLSSRRSTRSSRNSNANTQISFKLALEESLSLVTPVKVGRKAVTVVTPQREPAPAGISSQSLNHSQESLPDLLLSTTPKNAGQVSGGQCELVKAAASPVQTEQTPDANRDEWSVDRPKNPAMDAVPEDVTMETVKEGMQKACVMETVPEDIEMENAEEGPSSTPIPVQRLISIHETLIEKQQSSVPQSANAGSTTRFAHETEMESMHTSPELKQGAENGPRTVEEQIQSCMKKNPVISLAKMQEDMDTPQPKLVLTFEGSDEEDIADHVSDDVPRRNETDEAEKDSLKPVKNLLHKTPVGVAANAVRRSLGLELRLSLAESELGNSICAALTEADGRMKDEELEPMEDSLEMAANNDTIEKEQRSVDSTSQASSSVCSSSAATVILEATSCSEEEELPEEEPVEIRRSTRLQGRQSVITGVAAKRASTSMKLKLKKRVSEIKIKKKALEVPESNSTESEDSEEVASSDSTKSRPRIAKPVIRPPNIAKSGASTSSKRTRNALPSSPGVSSPAQPRAKYMKCASPLCTKPKTSARPAQRTRATFLNRSTAASRARRTPTKSATSSRTRAALIAGSPYKFGGGMSMCQTPSRTGALSVEVTSFIKRNTPQKVKPEEELAHKKQQLEEKQRREERLKKKREEEKLQKLAERKKKRSMRLRKAAELREKREREEKEKQQHKAEQWEKRVADADKVKVTRKKEEVEKIKKLQKKQAEAEEIRRREEEERIKKIKEQEQEKEQRLIEVRHQKEQEAAMKRHAEAEKAKERQKQEKLREEKEAAELKRKQDEEKVKREEEEKAKRRMEEETARLRQLKAEREEVDRKKKLKEEEEKAAKQEQIRVQKEKDAQLRLQEEAKIRQEDAARKKEKEEMRLAAQKKKLEQAQAALEEKARKKKEDEAARAEELRKRKEEIRKRAEQKREEEKLRLKEEKRRFEERRREREEEEREQQRKIQEANRKLRELEEKRRLEKERMQAAENAHNASHSTLNSTYTVDNNITSPQSYELTPQAVKTFAPSTAENYNIDDLHSGDSTDDDCAPRKVVPKWAKGGELRSILIKQYYNPPNLESVFMGALSLNEVRLHEIFQLHKPRYFKRTSSAHWTSPIMPPGHISFTEHCKGFD